jgi:hypothetical protein
VMVESNEYCYNLPMAYVTCANLTPGLVPHESLRPLGTADQIITKLDIEV